ncbi:MAG: DUF1385 domain-containing protein [Chloroflexi bacterium]|nr:DUF1385 domain-containing protein [Chloroflexota bacterium]
MMRGRRTAVVACRAPDGSIVIQREWLDGALYTARWARLPLIRGAVAIWDTMALGVRALMFASDVAAREPKPVDAEDQAPAAEGEGLPRVALWTTMAMALGGAIAFFFVLPVLVIGAIDPYIESDIVSNLVEKIIRLVIILGYMVAIGRMEEIRRVYQYHGAEHKTINAYEAGAPLTPESVQRFPIEHPRCGTTFLMIVVLVSFVLFSLLGRPDLEWRILSRILLIPLVAGIAFEFIRWASARYQRSGAIRALLAPGLIVQRLTTREPDLDQIAVAIGALQPVLDEEEASVRPTEIPHVEATPSFAS